MTSRTLKLALIAGLVLTTGGFAMAQEPERQAPPEPRTVVTLNDCQVEISALRSRYPALSAYLISEYGQDFDLVHGSHENAIRNFMGREQKYRLPIATEFVAFVKEFRQDQCIVEAWGALGATTGVDAVFIKNAIEKARMAATR